MSTADDNVPAFFCDAMWGGLARWLRAAGYDAKYVYGIDDGELIRGAREDGRVILSSDRPLFDRNVIRSGEVAAMYIPQQISRLEALRFVMRAMELPRRQPRCMACGGSLVELPKHSVSGEAPPLAYRCCERFWRCERCGKLLWRGTHWTRIEKRLQSLDR